MPDELTNVSYNHGLGVRRDDDYGDELVLYAEAPIAKDTVFDVYGKRVELDEHEAAWFLDDRNDFMPIAPFSHIVNNGGSLDPALRPNCDLIDGPDGYQMVTIRDIAGGEVLIAYVYEAFDAALDEAA
jgi:hypothetical protein